MFEVSFRQRLFGVAVKIFQVLCPRAMSHFPEAFAEALFGTSSFLAEGRSKFACFQHLIVKKA